MVILSGGAEDAATVARWRAIFWNNQTGRPPMPRILFFILTREKRLAPILTAAGFFTSNRDVARNRPDLVRNAEHGEVVNLRWCSIRIEKVTGAA